MATVKLVTALALMTGACLMLMLPVALALGASVIVFRWLTTTFS